MKHKKRWGFSSFFSADSLRIQLLSRSLLILAGLLVLIGLLQYIFMREVIYKNKADSLQSQIMSFQSFPMSQMVTSPENGIWELPRFFIPEASLAFIDVQGKYSLIWSDHRNSFAPPQLDAQEYKRLLARQPGQEGQPDSHFKPQKPDMRGRNYILSGAGEAEQLVVLQPVISLPGRELLGAVQISTPTEPLKQLLVRQLFTFLLLSLIALLLGLLAYLPVLNKTLVPLSNMVDTAGSIDAGNLDSRFPTKQGQAEIDRLAESFNGMLERLEGSFAAEKETKEQMRRFIADASHELRTPLTSIHGFLEVLLRGAANQPDKLDKALRSMHSESQRLNKLVHDLLLLSKLDRTPHVELKEGCLDAVIMDMEPQLHILAGGRNLELLIEPGMKCSFDANQMKQVILNLLFNAVQYTDADEGCIRLSLSQHGKGVRLSIQDNGPGISSEHLPRIFDRFYRSESSRTRKSGGAGLGLSITKSIVEAHGGSISVISDEGEGTTFYIWLPGTNE